MQAQLDMIRQLNLQQGLCSCGLVIVVVEHIHLEDLVHLNISDIYHFIMMSPLKMSTLVSVLETQ